jgi:hypothetical protein
MVLHVSEIEIVIVIEIDFFIPPEAPVTSHQ